MFLRWHREGSSGHAPAMPAPGYKWSETPKLNRAIQAKHQARTMDGVRADFESGYQEILKLVEGLSADRLLEPGHFAWTGTHPLTTYLGPNTASHYRFAMRMIRRWQRRASN